MARLRTKTGCLTCLKRRKKCDEALPKCGECTRLELACVRREQGGTSSAISATNLKGKTPPLRTTVTNGYPPFQSDLEKELSMRSPQALELLVSRIAGEGFRDVMLFGTFCTQSPLVREAVVAFTAFNSGATYEDSYKLALKSYQKCVTDLQRTRAYEVEDSSQRDVVLTAIMFLGLLEALRLGDSSSSVAHFEVCRRMLAARLAQPGVFENPALVKLYRVVAECIIYNLATLSPFHTSVQNAARDWESSFDCLFSRQDHTLSPFLGGLHGVYRVMFRTNSLLRETRCDYASTTATSSSSMLALGELWEELNALEYNVPASYHRVDNEDDRKLYTAKQRISVLALRIHLVKISRPSASTRDILVRQYVQKSIAILKQQNVQEDFNPAMRWPLTILACAAESNGDFDLIVAKMREIAKELDAANREKLLAAASVLREFRQKSPEIRFVIGNAWLPTDQLDYLLEPQYLDGIVKPHNHQTVVFRPTQQLIEAVEVD